MAPETAKELSVKINLNTVLTTVSALLVVAATVGIFSMKEEIENLKIESAKHGFAIDEVQRGVNRLQNKVDNYPNYQPNSNTQNKSSQ